MNCTNCGNELATNMLICPKCGVSTTTYHQPAQVGTQQAEEVRYPPPVQTPPTSYGSQGYQPYNSGPQSYVPPPPQYTQPQYTMPQVAPQPARTKKTGLFIGLGVLAVLVVVGSVLIAFARQTSATPTGPTADQLHATATSMAAATATYTAQTQNPYPPFGGNLVMMDPLKDNSQGFKWDSGTFADGASCGFSNGVYHVGKSVRGFFGCNPEARVTNLSNFVMEAQVNVLKGEQGGFIFRAPKQGNMMYYLALYTSGKYAGSYGLYSDTQAGFTLLEGDRSSLIKTGSNQPNTLAIVANGSSLDVYINLQHVGKTVTNTVSSSGQIGFGTFDDTQAANVAFSNVRVWQL